MGDLPANTPTDYLQQDKINNPPIEQKLEKIPQISEKVGGVVFDVKNGVAKIIISGETKNETNELNEQLKQELIEKLKQLPDYEGSRLQDTIEKGKLEIIKTEPISFKKQKFEIQVKNSKYALYEKGGNLLYFVELNGKKYFNVDKVRKGVVRGGIENGIEMFFGGKQILEDGIYNIYIGNRKLDIKSNEYRNIMLICGAEQILLLKELKELYEQKKELIKKFKQLPDYEGSKVQESIEKGTIEIKKIPGREVYALYESKVGNLIYLTELDGTEYVDITKIRKNDLFGSALIGGYKFNGYKEIILNKNTGLWQLYNKKGIEIPILSDEYATATLNATNYMLDFLDGISNEIERRGI